jgi:hypothetical protein
MGKKYSQFTIWKFWMDQNGLRKLIVVGFEVFTAVVMKSIFWDMTQRHIPEDDTLQTVPCFGDKQDCEMAKEFNVWMSVGL